MTISMIVMLLLATLTFMVVGVSALANDRARRTSLVDAMNAGRGNRFLAFRSGLERRILRTEGGNWLRRELDNADLTWPIADVVLIGIGLFSVITFFAYRVGGPVLCVVAVTLTLFGFRTWFRSREERRYARFVDQLPDLARLLANATSAGLSLRAALGVAAQETVEPTRGELERVNEELTLGSSIEDALGRMGARLPSRELSVLVNVLMIQSRSGGKVVSALQGITVALETRRDLRREVATLLAGSKATALAVGFLAGGMVLLVHNAAPGGLRALLGEIIGLVIFFVSLALFIVGMVLIRRASKVEV